MSEPKLHEQQVEARERETHHDGAEIHPEYRPRPSDALTRIHARLRGQGDPEEVPQLISMLTDADREALAAGFQTFSGLPGEVILRCASELPVRSALAVRVALSGHQNPSQSAVVGYLDDSVRLGELDEQTVATLRTKLPGSPLLLFQTLLRHLTELEANRAMLRWVVEATSPAPCAHVLGQALSPRMAATLDALQLW
ncbi:MAG: hypothetical protein ABI467_22420, partial [Kofleriaceae bacterium]